MSTTLGFNFTCKVPMESCKSQPSILCFLVISKLKGKHQILRNSKLQPSARSLRLQNTDRNRNMAFCNSSVEPGPIVPSTPTPGPGSWKPWILGILMSIILPMWRGNWRPLLKLKQEAETIIDTVEAVADIVEKVAEQVENVTDELGDLLPEGKLKDALETVEDLADATADSARIAGDFIDKVEDMVDQMEEKVESLTKQNSENKGGLSRTAAAVRLSRLGSARHGTARHGNDADAVLNDDALATAAAALATYEKYEKDNKTMTDDKPIMDQVHDYENLVADIIAEGMQMCEVLQANVLIEKLPKSWTDYRNSLKHKKRDISLEELVGHMKIEEANRLKDKLTNSMSNLSFRANLVESKFKKIMKRGNQDKKTKPQKATNFKKSGKAKPEGKTFKCYVCGLPGHKAYQCQHRSDRQNDNKPHMHVVEEDDEIIDAVVSEVNLVENSSEWVVDTGTSKHFCAMKEFFTEFEDGNTGERMYMGNSSSSEVLGKGKVLLKLTSEVENQLDRIKRVRSDRGGEYGSNFLKDICEKNDIIHETSAPYFPQQNGIAERKNRTLKEMMNSLLISSGLSDNMWGEAILSVTHILNGVPHKKLDSTPYELWKGYAPNLQYLKVWGCLAKVGLPDFKKSTIGPKTVDAVFIGYATNSAAYIFMLLQDYSIYPIAQIFLLDEDPKTFEEAIRSIDASFWKIAVNDELESIVSNHTWELVDFPKGFKPISNKWVFRKKLRPDGSIQRYKARLVVKGFTQRFGLDYFDTYSPVTKISTIRALFVLASIHKLQVHQMDVKTAFLNGDLDEEIYMEQPLDFEAPGMEGKVCRLKKSLYGRNSNIESINKVKNFLSTKFEMTDLGEVYVILGVKVTKTEKGFSLCQAHYIEKVLKKFDSFDVVPVRTPYDPSIHLVKNKGSSVSQTEYAKLIGSLMFLMNYTRPDIAYAVSRLSRYTHNPSGYCDANWVSDNDESEFIALDLAGQEAKWLRNLLADIPLWGRPTPPVLLLCDSQAAICVAKNQAYNGKKRHIRIRHESVRHLIKNGVLSLEYVKSERNLADPLTKGLSRKLVLYSSRGMGLKPIG
ncbi:hypothetical protein F3Y22_tig00112491pilonHSYRG00280 [Hibiscus syriacus]|uniref:Uncharacterized protein n=1 Tax=Hibiscus syriacus TaxID=106335 RepID=A0A6A2XX75_HIBSY|nr:hypothetical protein F3Y22_tig00112491pilonHSYRG00280 [Hibiscus syriacus]